MKYADKLGNLCVFFNADPGIIIRMFYLYGAALCTAAENDDFITVGFFQTNFPRIYCIALHCEIDISVNRNASFVYRISAQKEGRAGVDDQSGVFGNFSAVHIQPSVSKPKVSDASRRHAVGDDQSAVCLNFAVVFFHADDFSAV